MMSQLFLQSFQLKVSDKLFFWSFAWRKKSKSGLLQAKRWPFSGKKIPKRPQVYKNHKVFKLHVLSQAKKSLRPPKKQHVFNLLLKRLQKKLTHHENNPALFLSLVAYCIYAESSTILYINNYIWTPIIPIKMY